MLSFRHGGTIVLSERRHFDLHTDNSVSSKTSAFNITAYAVSRLRGDANSAQAVMLNLAIFTVGRNLNVKKHFFFLVVVGLSGSASRQCLVKRCGERLCPTLSAISCLPDLQT